MHRRFLPVASIGLFLVLLVGMSACQPAPVPAPDVTLESSEMPEVEVVEETLAPSSRLLTVCMGREPASLFLYGDESSAARGIRQAIYDGPLDINNFTVSPVLLQRQPDRTGGDVQLIPVPVQPGDLIQDAAGHLTQLKSGATYLPAGCQTSDCGVVYEGADPVNMDQLVVQYHLLPDVLWSDGAALTADDSLFSYQVASGLKPWARADWIDHTLVYTALNATTVEWRGVPGYRQPNYSLGFFSPLPRHAWGDLSPTQMLTAELSARMPLGWGPFQIEEWQPGDHITLSKNLNYFRAQEGLPHFDRLVFRFMPNKDEALAALQAGECDILDETTGLEGRSQELLDLKNSGQARVEFMPGAAWEHIDFGLAPANPAAGDKGPVNPATFLQPKAVRQALALCVDRAALAKELFFDQTVVPDTYVPPGHPLALPEVKKYAFDPGAAASLLQSVGWVDADNNPATPRVAAGVAEVADGTPFEMEYLVSSEPLAHSAAQKIQASLASCGVKINLKTIDAHTLVTPGPQGAVFGRNFTLAQFAWSTSLAGGNNPLVPACYLFLSEEIPGPYPQFPKGWGGANVSGYRSADFDQACLKGLSTLPDTPEYVQAHQRAQALFAEDLPALPLFMRLKVVAARPDLCNLSVDSSADSSLWNLETLDYGETCNP